MQLISGKLIASKIEAGLVQGGSMQKVLAIVRANADSASAKYVELKIAKANKLGISTKLIEFPDTTTKDEVTAAINKLNLDPTVTGVLVQLPLFPNLEGFRGEILNTIAPEKDVDGLTAVNQGRLQLGESAFVPATVGAVIESLRFSQWPDDYDFGGHEAEFANWLKGKNVVVINHSALIGRPLADILLNYGCTVSVCHEFTQNLKALTTQADIVVTATGKTQLFDHNFFKTGAVLVDCTSVTTPHGPTGDIILSPELEAKVAWLTPVPGGIGPVTIAYLLRNFAAGVN
ncbi:MAG: bifunctional 5,10-methylenetetrahydrofolate dehydrogenase/5,10-methenyltetrahydrofolate cyclohydrolase [Candidatus Doudnabacteria bacterium]|nr:bifunctional 5,10-methylenetetrahydrofolate dehydrogenase/5,10-methenyltetrahydrofolate cyclohydrolase [Candidatus Doudnabacteria bacterium]